MPVVATAETSIWKNPCKWIDWLGLAAGKASQENRDMLSLAIIEQWAQSDVTATRARRTMNLVRLTQDFDSKKEQLERLDQQRTRLLQELLQLQRQIQRSLDHALAPANASRRRSNGEPPRVRPRLTQNVVHDVLTAAGKALSFQEIEESVRAISPHLKTDRLNSILEMTSGPAIKAGSKWKANVKWVTKRGRPRKKAK